MKLRPMRISSVVGATLLAGATAFACSLEDGDLIGLGADDASTIIDSSTDVGANSEGSVSDANSGADASTVIDAGADGGEPPRFVFASTSTAIYALDVTTDALAMVSTFAACGILASAYDTIDPAQDSTGRVFLLTHVSSNGKFSFYDLQSDGGCVDVHGGTGSGPIGPGFWAGFQKMGATETLVALENNQRPVLQYNGMGDYLGQANNVMPSGGASSDIACTSALCYTALPANRCPSDSGATDCLFAFESDGGTTTQIGSFGKTGIVGIAYAQGFVYGFASDGSIIQISTTAPSVGMPVSTLGVSTTGLIWQGAASSSAY